MEPTSFSAALKAVAEVKKALDTAALKAKVDEIAEAIDAIGRHLAENVFTEVRAGFSHLEVAVTVSDANLRQDELGFARQSFNRLAERSGSDRLLDSYGSLSAAHVSALGHLGNYHYFLLRNQLDHALISAYRCTEQFPALGVWIFPVALFSRDYRKEVPQDLPTPNQIHTAHRYALASHREDRRRWGLEMAWRLPAAAGAAILGLAAGTVTPSLAGRGALWAISILDQSENGFIPPSTPSAELYLARAAEVERLLAPIAAEAHDRRLAVQRRVAS